MRKKSSDPPCWSRFERPDERDGIPRNRHCLMETWIRAGRLPEPPCDEDYPWSPKTWSHGLATLKKKAASPDETVFFQELEESLGTPEAARLAGDRAQWAQNERERSAAFLAYVAELEEHGVDGRHLIGLISGLTRKQPVNLFQVLREVRFLAFVHGPWRQYTRHLRRLWLRYQTALPVTV